MSRLLIWAGADDWRTEAAAIDLDASGLRASGTQLGIDPVPYRVDYSLETSDDFVTELLEVTASGSGWWRRLILSRDETGLWSSTVLQEDEGGTTAEWEAVGGEMRTLHGALDCDLGLSPLTNTMPVLREKLHRQAGSGDFRMAWVAVPSLAVSLSKQRYETLRVDPAGRSRVRYSSRHFTADLDFDADGFVLTYPGLARRVS